MSKKISFSNQGEKDAAISAAQVVLAIATKEVAQAQVSLSELQASVVEA